MESFEELYLSSSELLKEQPLELEHYRDIDKCMKYLNDNDLVKDFLDKGVLILYDEFEYRDFLPYEYIFDKKLYVLYFPIEIELIKMMTENTNKILNKWKLNCIEQVLLHGWKYYSELYLRKIFSKKEF
jgi:hypothetical protein